LEKLQQAAGTSENLLPRVLECVEAYATVGEISDTLRRIWGEYRETSTV
jgi:methylmalonyl-CoA mutase N-terminal domain/subunit